MPCYKPLDAWHAPGGISFDKSKSFGLPIQLPCQKCIGCRLERAKEWAIRNYHESRMHKHNCFITLTYRDADLPENGELKHEHFQLFMKRFRKKHDVRYFMCGEYGGQTNRPHYHAIIFGYDFPDKKLVNIRDGNRVYLSEELNQLWSLGSTEIGSVTYNSCGYVARYILKKQVGTADELFERYAIIDTETGEMRSKKLEYVRMSLKPGIGASFYEKYKTDIFPEDKIVLPDGRRSSTPHYYRRLLENENPALGKDIRNARVAKSRSNPDNTPERLATRERCKQAQAKRLKRTM